jgi:hypothetical protein
LDLSPQIVTLLREQTDFDAKSGTIRGSGKRAGDLGDKVENSSCVLSFTNGLSASLGLINQ